MSNLSGWTGIAVRGLAVVVSCSALPAAAGTILVPQQKPTIQAGIDAAIAGDTVLVAPGTYSGAGNRDIDLKGKPITVRSAGGAGSCTLVAQGSQSAYHCGFILQNNESAAAVIDGFTITGGFMFNGGGVCIMNGSATVRNCIMTGNYADCWGAGVYSQSAAGPRLVNCVVRANASADEGGGLFVISSNLRVEGCTIGNNAAAAGAGVCSFGGAPLYVNCQISDNTASYYGGGIYLWGGKMVNCTIAGNHADSYGSGVYGGGAGVITNSILWGNTGAASFEGDAAVNFSIVQGGAAGAGNRSTDPVFINAAAADFRLGHGSPAIDAGSNAQVPAGVLKDLAGSARFVDDYTVANTGEGAGSPVDMGAFEMGVPVRAPGVRTR